MTPTYYVQHPDGSYSVADPQPQQDGQAVPHLKKLLHAMHQEINSKHNLNEWLRASPAFAQRAAQAEAEWVVAVKNLVAVQMEAQKYVQESAAPTPPCRRNNHD